MLARGEDHSLKDTEALAEPCIHGLTDTCTRDIGEHWIAGDDAGLQEDLSGQGRIRMHREHAI